ncbi:MAG: glucose-6-phosphate dehydrogenase [Epulopiscium sp.]|nr:glucose-6-phosphate dehydrogenase [Candidatus Epulonipiscium sp.]
MNKDQLSSIMVIFGGTGDLTHRKLIPALYNLLNENKLPPSFAVVAIGRRDKTNEEYRKDLKEAAQKFSRFKIQEEKWADLEKRIYYYSLNFMDGEGYPDLEIYLRELENKYKTQGNRMYYLAVAPEYFEVIVGDLHKNQMTEKEGSWRRVVIEKPFGQDLESAQYLNHKITHAFSEENTYRIDHYLGKEMLQNIMVIRFANAFFEPIWNNKYIDHIQISSSEVVGVEERGGYYEKAGVLKDMLQNHMLQLLALTAMEPPVRLDTQSIRDEKVKVLKGLQQMSTEEVKANVIWGQYGAAGEIKGYREENRISPESNTETFMALKVQIENFRWSGVPFYIRTGKRMPTKSTEIIVQFKSMPKILYWQEYEDLQPNLLVIRVQPMEGVFMQFNAKQPGTETQVVPVQMDFCQNCHIGSNSPEAYERLLYDVMRGDSTLFTRWDEVEYSWRFIDTIAKVRKEMNIDFPNYEAGTWGPKKAQELLQKDGREWWNI